MKRFLAALLALTMLLSLCGCSKRSAEQNPGGAREPVTEGGGAQTAEPGGPEEPADDTPGGDEPGDGERPGVYPDGPLEGLMISVDGEDLAAMEELTDYLPYFVREFDSVSELTDAEMFFTAMVLGSADFYNIADDPLNSYIDFTYVQPAVKRVFGSEARLSDGWVDMTEEETYPYVIDRQNERISVMGMGLPWPCQYTVYAAKTGENEFELHRLYLSDPLFEQANGQTFDAFLETGGISFELVKDIADDMTMCRYVLQRSEGGFSVTSFSMRRPAED